MVKRRGFEIMQLIAVPVIGSMVSSTLLTLIVIPAIFGLVRGVGLPREPRAEGTRGLADSVDHSQAAE